MPAEPQPVSPPLSVSGRALSTSHLWLWLILFVAAALRLARLDLTAFEMDEGAACLLAVRFTHYGLFPLVGVKTSLQFFNTPLFIYALSPAFLVTTDARFAVMLFALFGTAAVYVVYRTGREFVSPAVGLLAAAMMAVSPTAVEYSRRLWGHSLIQALCPIVLYLMLRWVVAGRAKTVFWLAMLIAMAQQFHFSASLLWVLLALAWLIFRPRTDWVAFVGGLIVGLLGYVPFFFEEADTGFADVRIIGQAILHGSGQATGFSLKPLVYWFFAATDLGHNNFLQYELSDFLSAIPLYQTTRAIAGAAWGGALMACGVWVVRDKLARRRSGESAPSESDTSPSGSPPPTGSTSFSRLSPLASCLSPLASRLQPPASRLQPPLDRLPTCPTLALPLLFLTWSLVPLIVFLLLRVLVVAPYFLVVYPVPFLAIAWAAVELWRKLGTRNPEPATRKSKIENRKSRIGTPLRHSARILLVCLFAAWGIHQLIFHFALLVRLDGQGGGVGSYASFGEQRGAMHFVANYAPGRPVVVSEDQLDPARGIDFRYWFLLWTFDHNMQRFFPPDREQADYWFVIRNTNYDARPDFAQFLAAYPSRRFGFLRLYVIPRPGPWPRFGP